LLALLKKVFVILNRQIHKVAFLKVEAARTEFFFFQCNFISLGCSNFAGSCCLGDGDWGSGDRGGGVGSVGDRGSSNVGSGDGGGSVGSVSNGGSGDGNGGGLGVGEGLVDGLVDVGGGSDWSDDGLLGEDGLLPEDGLGSVVGVLNGGGLDVGNGSGLMDDGGLSNGVGDGAQLGGDLGESLGGDDTVGEVSTQTVALDGGAVVLGGTDDVGGSGHGGGDGGNDASVGDSQETSKNDEGLEKVQETIFSSCP